MVASKTRPPGILQLAYEGRTEHGGGARFCMRHAQVEGGGARFCIFHFKHMQKLDVLEQGGYHVLYVMCKTLQPGVHQVAHDGPDGITTCS